MTRFRSSMLAITLLGAATSVACGGGDGGSGENANPGEYQPPSQGVTLGPDDEIVHLGTEPGSHQQEQQPATPETPSAADCSNIADCQQFCACLGQSSALCSDYCGGTSDSGDQQGDVCAGLTDPCVLCLCQTADVTACTAQCGQ